VTGIKVEKQKSGYNTIMFNLPNAKIDRACPECMRPLVELAKFAEVMDNDGMLRDQFSSPISGGGQAMLFLELFDMMINNIVWYFRREKIKKIIRATLPDYPDAQICANCFFLLRRP
jgi:hypothetical protein